MFVRSIVADAFGTNCYVVAPEEGEECVLVDPGFGVVERVREVLAQHRLRPAAVLLTHGHLDHVYSVTPVCGGTTAAYIHGDDAYRLKDPVSLLTEPVRLALEQLHRVRPVRRGHPVGVRGARGAPALVLALFRTGDEIRPRAADRPRRRAHRCAPHVMTDSNAAVGPRHRPRGTRCPGAFLPSIRAVGDDRTGHFHP